MQELRACAGKLGIRPRTVDACLMDRLSKLNVHDTYNLLVLNIPDARDALRGQHKLCIYHSAQLLLFICDHDPVLEEMLRDISEEPQAFSSLARILLAYLDRLTRDDGLVLDDLEQQISALEDNLITTGRGRKDYVHQVVVHRKRLMVLGRFYDQLQFVCETLLNCNSDLVDASLERGLGLFSSRVDRLYHSVLHLRDYVTQVREAYQAQVDINQNNLMQIFTVITTVCLPLTLIAGWYGMNFRMPEYEAPHGYLYVIVLSLSCLGLLVHWFKKRKWL
nr:CorA family divalent cation transporter [Maliibacterium massiliense]